MSINRVFQMAPFAPIYPDKKSIKDSRLEMIAAGKASTLFHDQRSASALGDGDRIVKASDGFLNLFGYSMEDLREGSLAWRHLAPSPFRDSQFCGLERARSLVDVEPFERKILRKDGTPLLVEIAPVILEAEPFLWFASVRPAGNRVEPEAETQPVSSVTSDYAGFVGNCGAIKTVMQMVDMVAPTEATVLIEGETGTGKELVAHAIHQRSLRKDAPFVTLNCAAVPAGLLESELFGHEKGAFTGAQGRRLGRFEMANGGTLFLDEVGDLPFDLQSKLLRALQEKTIERLGSGSSIPVNVRIIAATNRDLIHMVRKNEFRADLFYRLHVFPITTPALRNRGNDINLLVNHFTQHFAAKMGKKIDQIPVDTMRALCAWSWPGNVRELENFIERSVILTSKNVLQAPLKELHEDAPAVQTERLDEWQRHHVLSMLKKSNGVVTKAAERLGMCRTTLNALMARLKIERKDFV